MASQNSNTASQVEEQKSKLSELEKAHAKKQKELEAGFDQRSAQFNSQV